MNAEQLTNNDARLRALLKECKVAAKLPPRFQEQVWRRIARHEQQSSILSSLRTSLTHWLGAVLPRPTLAVSYLAVLLVAGASAGWAQARQEKARLGDELSMRYVRSVDPYQAVR